VCTVWNLNCWARLATFGEQFGGNFRPSDSMHHGTSIAFVSTFVHVFPANNNALYCTVLNCTSVLSLLILSTDLFDCLQFIFLLFALYYCVELSVLCAFVTLNKRLLTYLLTYLLTNSSCCGAAVVTTYNW